MTDSFVCVDLETTGLNPKTDKIIEIGAVKVVNGVETDFFSTFVNPGRRLDEHITQLTGIRDEDLTDAPYIQEVLPELLAFLEGQVWLGHRVIFDYSFVKKAALDAKLPLRALGIDTLQLARKYLPEAEKKNLEYLCEYFQIPHKAHRALDDARATVKLYEILCEKFEGMQHLQEEPEVGAVPSLFSPKLLVCNIKRDTPATKAQKEQLCRLLSLHKLELGADVEQMSRSEAGRTIDKILAKYGR